VDPRLDGGARGEVVAELLLLQARMRPVGHLEVRRLLPAAKRQSVGPFLFFDHFGPEEFEPFKGADIGPHPHIGLSTVTYLFEGNLVHRDSIGSVQPIEPGAINWMTAGRGIAHSERTPPELRAVPRRSHGLQLWAGMPRALEDGKPGFAHTASSAIPAGEREDAQVRVLVGRAWGMESPVTPVSETLYVDLSLPAGGGLEIPALAAERALYAVDGAYQLNGKRVAPYVMAVLPAGETVRVQAETPARVMLIGGEPLDGPRFIWWNFVSSKRETIRAAAAQWSAHQTPRIEGETDWVPLPSSSLPA
jgi:redox-sensitive bicupin YhaK (pirin superfamily)